MILELFMFIGISREVHRRSQEVALQTSRLIRQVKYYFGLVLVEDHIIVMISQMVLEVG